VDQVYRLPRPDDPYSPWSYVAVCRTKGAFSTKASDESGTVRPGSAWIADVSDTHDWFQTLGTRAEGALR
jgi:hypothetical protein